MAAPAPERGPVLHITHAELDALCRLEEIAAPGWLPVPEDDAAAAQRAVDGLASLVARGILVPDPDGDGGSVASDVVAILGATLAPDAAVSLVAERPEGDRAMLRIVRRGAAIVVFDEPFPGVFAMSPAEPTGLLELVAGGLGLDGELRAPPPTDGADDPTPLRLAGAPLDQDYDTPAAWGEVRLCSVVLIEPAGDEPALAGVTWLSGAAGIWSVIDQLDGGADATPTSAGAVREAVATLLDRFAASASTRSGEA